jgi:hypothetical protein
VKKLIAIFLVFLLLFNAMGFYGLLQGLRYKTTLELEQRLDNHQYSVDETTLLKVPIAVPYAIHADSYERVYGEFEHEGEYYRLVKQKYQNDTLYMVCIKDQTTKRIEQALTDYVKTFTDKPVDSKNTAKNFTSFIRDFLPTLIGISTGANGWNYSVAPVSGTRFFSDRSLVVFTPPPQSQG